VIGRPVDEDAAGTEEVSADAHLLAERRHRASVAPEDQATYSCSCGFVFQASVSTSVACPHCGTGQAW
jgi:predicted Zn-ribbon and HTH transcriptional regulator